MVAAFDGLAEGGGVFVEVQLLLLGETAALPDQGGRQLCALSKEALRAKNAVYGVLTDLLGLLDLVATYAHYKASICWNKTPA